MFVRYNGAQYYKFVEAAGGAVFNASNELLMIHRLDKWDLPKGKLDPGETTQQAALREVTEETAITNLTIVEPVNLPHTGAYTYHTFVDHNGKRMLKRTAWYVMRCPGHPIGKPQTSEGISEIKWIPQSEIQTTTTNRSYYYRCGAIGGICLCSYGPLGLYNYPRNYCLNCSYSWLSIFGLHQRISYQQ
jgi:8-oxo-dGTP pyrophosphatase MutT (NUDIX family)